MPFVEISTAVRNEQLNSTRNAAYIVAFKLSLCTSFDSFQASSSEISKTHSGQHFLSTSVTSYQSRSQWL